MHKKAQLGEQIMVFMFIFLMFVIGAGIVLGTYFFVGPEFDFRNAEADMLSYKIRTCINANEVVLTGDAEQNLKLVYEKCSINKNLLDMNNFIKICDNTKNPLDCVNKENPVLSSAGPSSFQPCGFLEKNKFLGCSMNNFVKDDKIYTILVTSKQTIRRNAK